MRRSCAMFEPLARADTLPAGLGAVVERFRMFPGRDRAIDVLALLRHHLAFNRIDGGTYSSIREELEPWL